MATICWPFIENVFLHILTVLYKPPRTNWKKVIGPSPFARMAPFALVSPISIFNATCLQKCGFSAFKCIYNPHFQCEQSMRQTHALLTKNRIKFYS